MIMPTFQEFYIGMLDMSCLKYGVITLIPKLVGATDIRHFRPITVIDVLQQIFSKVCAMWFAPVVEHLSHPCQFAFFKGRRIHDGILNVHELYLRSRCSVRKVFSRDLISKRPTTLLTVPSSFLVLE